jgi:iron complex transport system substrate-binding protein
MLVARPDTYTGDAIARAGGGFALDGGAALAQVSPESILAADPDMLLWAGSEAGLRDLVAEPGWSGLRAVREGRAHVVSRTQLLIPGPRTVDGIAHLATLFEAVA